MPEIHDPSPDGNHAHPSTEERAGERKQRGERLKNWSMGLSGVTLFTSEEIIDAGRLVRGLARDLLEAESELAVRDTALRDACREIADRELGRHPDESIEALAAEFLARARERQT